MNLKDLINNIDLLNEISSELLDYEIKGITDNSSKISNGDLFVAISGYQKDGHDFINDAIEAGAIAIIGEKDTDSTNIPYIKVPNSRKSLGILAKNYYNDPSKRKITIGITGTNGKTTTSYLIRHVLEEQGITCSVIGTNQNIINGEIQHASQTTPSSLELHKLLQNSNDQVVILEVSSHGLAQHRIEGIEFDYCLFTNLGHDHLDYHLSVEEYFKTKQLLFDKLKPDGVAVINADDHYGNRLLTSFKSRKNQLVISIGREASNSLTILKHELSRTPSMKFKQDSSEFAIGMPLPGIHNLYNAAMAYVTSHHFGVDRDKIVNAIDCFPGVAGRFEITTMKNGVIAVIDYAHTPEAIFYCLEAVKSCGANRVIHVFGFRGNRDLSKREEMVKVSAKLSDKYILTFDDLNSVAPGQMAQELVTIQHKSGKDHGIVIPDRTLAIEKAVTSGQRGDWVVITGKGHESYQQTYQTPSGSDKETLQIINQLLS